MSETESSQESWSRWAQSLRESNRSEFQEGVKKLAPVVRNWFIWKGVKDFRDAEELTDDVFVWAWQHRATYDKGKAKPRTWFTKCACQFALRNYLARHRRLAHELIDPQILAEQVQDKTAQEAPPPQPHKRILAFLAALKLLPDVQRQIIQKLLEVYDLRNGEIAEQLNLTEGRVSVYKCRAFKKVKEIMDGGTDESPEGGRTDASE